MEEETAKQPGSPKHSIDMNNMNKAWIFYIVLIVIAFVLIVIFSKDIYLWFSNKLFYLLFLVLIFAAVWVLGRFGRGRRRSAER